MSKRGGGRAWAGEKPLILASSSAARHALLSSRGIEAELRPADLDERMIEAEETMNGALPGIVARRLAAEKARAVSQRSPHRFVLGADQVLAFEDRCWAKAVDRKEAASRLGQLAGRRHMLISACAVAYGGSVLFEAAETAELAMRALSTAEIDTYLDVVGDEALASVGGYRIEGIGRLLFDRIEGEHATILGLPLSGFLRYFRSIGLLRL
ncbi:MAG: Maf family protein [Hyphomicrobiales bacterium]